MIPYEYIEMQCLPKSKIWLVITIPIKNWLSGAPWDKLLLKIKIGYKILFNIDSYL
jgi:hypothetical protein